MVRNAWLCVVMLAAAGCQSMSRSPQPTEDDRHKLAEINTQLGIAYMRDGDNALALTKLEKAIAADPRSVDAHNAMGLLYARLGETAVAEKHFKDALSVDPKNASALNNYGQFLCQQQRYAEGQARFAEALKNPLNPAPENALTNAGLCAMQAKDNTTAEQHFRGALQANPHLASALLPMAELNADAANYLQARAYYQRYLEVGPQTARTLLLGIRIEHELGDKDALASYALQLKNKYPDSTEYSLYQQGNYD